MRAVISVFFILLMFAAPLAAADFPPAGKPGVISLSDEHCMPCKMMSRLIEKLGNEYQGELAATTINALKDRDAAAKYSPQTLPTIVFFNKQGEEVARHAGIMDEAAMREIIEQLLAE